MAVIAERSPVASPRWARRLASFAAVLFAVSAAGHRYGFIETPGLFWLLGLVALIATGALLLAANGSFEIWHRGGAGGADVAWAVCLAAAVLTPFVIAAWRVYAYPALSDISTDTADPPSLAVAATLRSPDMNPVAPITPVQAAIQGEAYPEMTGRRYSLSADRVQELAVDLVRGRGWELAAPPSAPPSGGEGRIEALAKTPLLALPVDVSIRVTDEGDTSYVDMRSASRFGSHDLGDNAARIGAFLSALDTAVAGAAGTPAQEAPPPELPPASEGPTPSDPPPED